MSECALTIPAAADLIPFSGTTLRKYVRAWEDALGPLPTDASGYTRLVEPLLAVFAEAHRLRETDNAGRKVRLERALEVKATRVPEIVATYKRCGERQALAGVEEFSDRLTNKSLLHLAARLERLEEARAKDRSEHHDAVEDLAQYILEEMSAWANVQREDVVRVVEAFQIYADRLAKASRVLQSAAAPEPTPDQVL